MTEFFKKHKEKSLAALLLLAWRRGRGAAAVLLMLAVLSAVFIFPAGLLERIPLAGTLARRWASRGEGSYFAELLRKARSGEGLRPGEIALLRKAAAYRPEYGKSTVDYVKAAKEEVVERPSLKGSENVKEVVGPEEARRLGEGLALSEEELQNGLIQGALAGIVGSDGLVDPKALLSRFGFAGFAPLGSGKLKGGKAENREAGFLAGSLGGAVPPEAGDGGARGRGGRGGPAGGNKLGWYVRKDVALRSGGALALRGGRPGGKLYLLAETKTYSQAAAPTLPGAKVGCDSPGCADPTASTLAGATFDGGHLNIGLRTDPEEAALPQMPEDAQVGSLLEQGHALDQAALRCQQAQALHQPAMNEDMRRINEGSRWMSDHCRGGCSKKKARRCQRYAENNLYPPCRDFNYRSRQIADACSGVAGYSASVHDNPNCH